MGSRTARTFCQEVKRRGDVTGGSGDGVITVTFTNEEALALRDAARIGAEADRWEFRDGTRKQFMAIRAVQKIEREFANAVLS